MSFIRKVVLTHKQNAHVVTVNVGNGVLEVVEIR